MSQQATRNFRELLGPLWQSQRFVCVGLDSEYELLPESVKDGASVEDAIFQFNRAIIDATSDLVCAYKPNIALYEGAGIDALRALSRTINYLNTSYPEIPVILDAKRGDNSNSNKGYVRWAFDELKVDAITVHPYIGKEVLAPFLARKDKGIIVLVRTSNPGDNEFQELLVGPERQPLYQVIAQHVAQEWNSNGNCCVVVGATVPEQLSQVRAIIGDLPILIPGVGAQGGDVAATVKAGRDSRGQGMIINSSRGIIFASRNSDFALEARAATEKLHEEILAAL